MGLAMAANYNKERTTMAKHSNPNAKENTDPYPKGFDSAKVREMVDENFESEISRLDNEQGSEKGGR
jgi:hypothetical protein